MVFPALNGRGSVDLTARTEAAVNALTHVIDLGAALQTYAYGWVDNFTDQTGFDAALSTAASVSGGSLRLGQIGTISGAVSWPEGTKNNVTFSGDDFYTSGIFGQSSAIQGKTFWNSGFAIPGEGGVDFVFADAVNSGGASQHPYLALGGAGALAELAGNDRTVAGDLSDAAWFRGRHDGTVSVGMRQPGEANQSSTFSAPKGSSVSIKRAASGYMEIHVAGYLQMTSLAPWVGDLVAIGSVYNGATASIVRTARINDVVLTGVGGSSEGVSLTQVFPSPPSVARIVALVEHGDPINAVAFEVSRDNGVTYERFNDLKVHREYAAGVRIVSSEVMSLSGAPEVNVRVKAAALNNQSPVINAWWVQCQ